MKKIVVIYVVCIFILAPIGAFALSKTSHRKEQNVTNITQPSNTDALSALKIYNENITKVDSIRKVDNWWYLATVQIKDYGDSGYFTSTAVLYKFTSGADLKVAITPNGDSFTINITPGAGLPYEIFDMYTHKGNE